MDVKELIQGLEDWGWVFREEQGLRVVSIDDLEDYFKRNKIIMYKPMTDKDFTQDKHV